MSKARKAINLIAGLAILFGLSYCTYSFGSAESRMRTVCSDINPGMSASDLRRFASDHGLTAPGGDSGTQFLAESRTFGRWSCRVVLANGIVQSAEYGFAD